MYKRLFLSLLTILLASSVIATSLSLDQLLTKVQDKKNEIKDMYCETTTIITSNMSIPGQESEGPQKTTQKSKMWVKGNKTRIEMLEPTKQITINDGKKAGANTQNMSLDKAKEYFNLSLKTAKDKYVVAGVPKEKNKIFGKMEFVIDKNKMIPTMILMYTPQGKLLSKTTLQYKEINKQMVPVKNISDVNTPMGSMHIEMEYKNVKVNEGIDDSFFMIQE